MAPAHGLILIRADASVSIGAGHVMRCLALAQAWQDEGGTALFATSGGPNLIENRLHSEGIPVERLAEVAGGPDDAAQTVALALRQGVAWVIVDGYHFDGAYQRAIKDAGLRLLAVDDYGHADSYAAELILNQNLHAVESLYPCRESCTRLLLGPRYVLLRREFQRWQSWERTVPEIARRLLVTMGGSDPDNVTLSVMQAVRKAGVVLETEVLVGANNPHREMLESAVNSSSVRLWVNADDMPSMMAAADIAISASGSTSWEMAFMGLPSLLLVLAENQRPLARKLAEAGAGVDMGDAAGADPARLVDELRQLAGSPSRRLRASQSGRCLIDGYGARRVVGAMMERMG